MKHSKALRHLCLILILLVLAFPRDVHAYLDPGTGSLAFQAAIAALAAAAYAVRSYWSKIRLLFARRDTASPVVPHDEQV